MNIISFTTMEFDSKLEIGRSKFLGSPDVWNEFEWPYIKTEEGEADLNFLCQINCNEVYSYDSSGLLPKKGMLYFFYNLEQMPTSINDENAARVAYYDGNINDLHEMILLDDNGSKLESKEQKIIYLYDGKQDYGNNEIHNLLGDEETIKIGSNIDRQFVPLLSISSFCTSQTSVRFPVDMVLRFYIEKVKFENKDFSDVRAALVNR